MMINFVRVVARAVRRALRPTTPSALRPATINERLDVTRSANIMAVEMYQRHGMR